MAVTYVEIEDKYTLKSTDKPVRVSVEIGDAGVGAYLIFLDLALKGANQPASMGLANAVKNKRSVISATVPDVLEETNWTSVKVIVHEGTEATQFGPYSKEVNTHLDTVCFVIKILNV